MDTAPLEAGARLTRAFVAVDIPPVARAELAAYTAGAAALAPGFRWAPASNLHLTVRFCGGVEVETLSSLRRQLQAVRAAPFQMALAGLGSFGGRRPRVIFLHVTGELSELAEAVELACRAAGLEAEERPFRAHLTLARAAGRDRAALPELPAPPVLAPWRVESFRLYESRLGHGPAVYSVLEEFRLNPGS